MKVIVKMLLSNFSQSQLKAFWQLNKLVVLYTFQDIPAQIYPTFHTGFGISHV